jgi:hypothetical protein
VGASFRATPFLLVSALLLACSGGAGRLAVVGGHAVTVEKLSAFVAAQTGRGMADVSPELVAAMFERYLEDEVLLAASPSPGDADLTPTARSARARDALLSLCPPPPPPSQQKVDAYLAQHPELGEGERLRLRQLILPDQATAQLARDRLRNREDFTVVSRELSRAPNAASGGLIGWVERGQLPPEFEAVVFSLAPGEVSEPVQSNAGWHVFQVMERRGPGSPPDEALRARVRGQLGAAAAEAARRACLSGLAARVGVRVDCAGAAFPCRNPFEGQP